MREALVAVFDTAAHADQAVTALETASVPATAIRRYHRNDPAVQGASSTDRPTTGGVHHHTAQAEHRTPGFWSWLLGEEGDTTQTGWRDPEYADEDDRYYANAVETGNTVVAVYVDETNHEHVTEILAAHNPLSLRDSDATGASGTLDQQMSTETAEQRMGTGETSARMTTARTEQRMGHGTEEERIPLAEEQVEIGKQRVEGTVRVRRFVVERPIEQQVNLRDERVEIERRRPVGETATGRPLEERTVEVRESREEPTVTKTVREGEEVVVRKESGERTETVRDTVRKEDVEVDRASRQ